MSEEAESTEAPPVDDGQSRTRNSDDRWVFQRKVMEDDSANVTWADLTAMFGQHPTKGDLVAAVRAKQDSLEDGETYRMAKVTPETTPAVEHITKVSLAL